LQDLVSKLIVLDPAKRLTAKQALHHPWVQVSSFKLNHGNGSDFL
jgi:serine/threonine protein kinase